MISWSFNSWNFLTLSLLLTEVNLIFGSEEDFICVEINSDSFFSEKCSVCSFILQGSYRPWKVLEFDLGPGKLLEFEKWANCFWILAQMSLKRYECFWKMIKNNNALYFWNAQKRVRNAGYVRARCDILFKFSALLLRNCILHRFR